MLYNGNDVTGGQSAEKVKVKDVKEEEDDSSGKTDRCHWSRDLAVFTVRRPERR